jgi:hypothetical protein
VGLLRQRNVFSVTSRRFGYVCVLPTPVGVFACCMASHLKTYVCVSMCLCLCACMCVRVHVCCLHPLYPAPTAVQVDPHSPSTEERSQV